MHDGIKTNLIPTTMRSKGATPSGPSVFRSFPWPPAPAQTPDECSSQRHARPLDYIEYSGSVARKVVFFQQTRTDAHGPEIPSHIAASTVSHEPKGPAPLSGRYSKKSAHRTSRDMPYANSSHVILNVCASFLLLPETTAGNPGPPLPRCPSRLLLKCLPRRVCCPIALRLPHPHLSRLHAPAPLGPLLLNLIGTPSMG